jgi:hypothetical protein
MLYLEIANGRAFYITMLRVLPIRKTAGLAAE